MGDAVTPDMIRNMKVPELRKVAEDLGVAHKGLLKAPLQAALYQALEARDKKEEAMEVADDNEEEQPAQEEEEEEGDKEEAEPMEEEEASKEEEGVVPLTAKNLEKQGLDTRSDASEADASRVATADMSSVRDDVRSLSSAVGDEEGTTTQNGSGRDAAPTAKEVEVEKKGPSEKQPSPVKPAAQSPPKQRKHEAPPPPAVPQGKDRETALLEKLRNKMPPPAVLKTSASGGSAGPPSSSLAAAGGEEAENRGPVPPASNPVSCTIRVDGFVRPFTQPRAQALVQEKGGGPLEGFWMDAIKTHCYATFKEEQHAVNAREALYNLVWPERGGTLKVDFADITAKEADQRAAAARAARLSGGAVRSATAPGASLAAKTLEKSNSLLQSSASNGSLSSRSVADQEASGVRRKRELGPSPDRDKRQRIEGEGEEGGDGASKAVNKTRKEVPKQPIFDDLYRSTKTKPKLYWQTVSEEKVLAKRKRNAELKALEKERRQSSKSNKN